jgi:hypothetical protein
LTKVPKQSSAGQGKSLFNNDAGVIAHPSVGENTKLYIKLIENAS